MFSKIWRKYDFHKIWTAIFSNKSEIFPFLRIMTLQSKFITEWSDNELKFWRYYIAIETFYCNILGGYLEEVNHIDLYYFASYLLVIWTSEFFQHLEVMELQTRPKTSLYFKTFNSRFWIDRHSLLLEVSWRITKGNKRALWNILSINKLWKANVYYTFRIASK